MWRHVHKIAQIVTQRDPFQIVMLIVFRRYSSTVESLLKEAQLSRDVHVCDNIDLETIILEYADYYYAKYNRYPKFCKKAEAAGNVAQNTYGIQLIMFARV